VQLPVTCLSLELNREELDIQLFGTGFWLELNRAGVEYIVKEYRFVFGN
jgi:hypothetical protein